MFIELCELVSLSSRLWVVTESNYVTVDCASEALHFRRASGGTLVELVAMGMGSPGVVYVCVMCRLHDPSVQCYIVLLGAQCPLAIPYRGGGFHFTSVT